MPQPPSPPASAPHPQASALREHDLLALQGRGISADGAGHMTPLAMAVRQRSLEVCRLLLQWGASPDSRQNDGIPLLLHLVDALRSAPLPSSSHSGGCGGGGGSTDSGTLLQLQERSTASSSGWCPAWQAASPGDIQAAACNALSAVAAGAAGRGPSDASSRILGLLEDAEQRLQLLHLLLRHQADPLEAALAPAAGQPTFLSGANSCGELCCAHLHQGRNCCLQAGGPRRRRMLVCVASCI